MAIVLSSETMYAALKSPKLPQRQSGIGKIEITDNGVFLKTAGERIPIENPENASLQNGQAVRYTVKDDTLQITPLPSDPQQALNPPGDLLTLTESDPAVPPSSPVRTAAVFPVENVQPGIYIVTSLDDLKTFTTANLGRETLELIKTGLATDGAITLHIDSGTDGALRAVIRPVRDLTVALQQLSASLTSTLFSSVSPDLLGQLLTDRGNLPFVPLQQLDTLLKTAATAFPAIRAGAAEAQKNALGQWLHTALITEPSSDIVALAPRASAGAMMSDLEPVLAPLSQQTGISLPATGIFSLPGLPDKHGENISPLLSPAIDRIGFTLEHSLAAADTSENKYTPQQTLKSLLLHLIGTLSADRKEPVLTPSPQPVSGDNSPSPLQAAGSTTGSTPSTGAQRSADLATVLSDLRGAIAAITRPIPHGASSGIDILPVLPSSESPVFSGKSTAAAIPASGNIPQSEPMPLPPDRIVTITNLIGQTTAALASYRGLSETAAPPDTAVAVLSDTIWTLASAIAVPAPTDSAETAALRNGTAAPAPTFPPTLLPLLRNTLDAIDSMLRWLQKTEGTAPATLEPDGTASRERATIGQPIPDGNLPVNGFQRQQLVHALGTALDRLESLQLLARQVTTTQGTQQIIALPIKFGETWTEINVRFLHRKKKQVPGKGAARLSVTIDVAPPALGAIHANLDYRPSRDLHLTVDFEHKTTRSWFVNHRDELQKALQLAGIAAVRIDMRQSRRKDAPTGCGKPVAGSALIDMKV